MLAWSFTLLLVMVIALLGLLNSRAAYRNGFWDGVLWERGREGRVFPDNSDHTCVNADCVICASRTPGWESLHPSKPGPSWHGWASLAAGARQRAGDAARAAEATEPDA